MAEVRVEPISANTFRVIVKESDTRTTHEVTIDALPAVAEDVPLESLIEASFRFLLDREPKETILPSFDLGVIEQYYPEYRDRIGDYL